MILETGARKRFCSHDRTCKERFSGQRGGFGGGTRVALQSAVHRGTWSRLIVHGRWSSIMGSFLEQRPSQKLNTNSVSAQVAGRVT